MADTTTAPALPATMRAWVLAGPAAGGLEKAMRLVPDHPVPDAWARIARGDATAPGGRDAVLVQVLYASINPVDYKVPEMPVIGRFVPRRPATPCVDFCGRVVAATAPGFQVGQLVAGKADDLAQHGSLAEYTLAHAGSVAAVPAGVDAAQAATIAVGGTTAWGAVAPGVQAAKEKKKNTEGAAVHVFVNGASGGVGSYAVQIAKALGCTVTATCSTANVALVQSLGADRILDYRVVSPEAELVSATGAGAGASAGASASSPPVDVAVDCVGHSFALYKAGDAYLAPGAPFVMVGVHPGPAAHILLRPGLLGGGHHPAPLYMNRVTHEGLAAILSFMAEGQLKVPIEKEVAMEDVPAAFALLKTERTRGKIVVKVAEDA